MTLPVGGTWVVSRDTCGSWGSVCAAPGAGRSGSVAMPATRSARAVRAKRLQPPENIVVLLWCGRPRPGRLSPPPSVARLSDRLTRGFASPPHGGVGRYEEGGSLGARGGGHGEPRG